MFVFSELVRYEKTLKKFSNICSKDIDYSYKSKVLSHNVNSYINSARSKERISNIISDVPDYSIRNWLYETFGMCEVLESYRINNAYYHRLSRLRSRICKIVSSRSFFLTFTWSDKYLRPDSPFYLSDITRRRYVQRFLNSYCNDFVANIDYGESGGREHYHAVVQCDRIISSYWKYGNLDFKLITYTDNDCELLSKYVDKLVNHAIKESAQRCHLIYKRKVGNNESI